MNEATHDPLAEWVVVSSKSGKDANGLPLGEKLCKCCDLQRMLNELNIKDVIVRPYIPEYGFKMTRDEIEMIKYCLTHTSNHLILNRIESKLISTIQEKLNYLEFHECR